MRVRLGVLRLVRSLSGDRSERRRLGAAIVALWRHRSRSLAACAPVLAVVPTAGKVKLLFWKAMASSRSDLMPTPVASTETLAEAVRSTHSYANAIRILSHDRNGFLQRGPEYAELRRRWSDLPPERVVVFHHYDRRGWLPASWQEALLAMQTAGWQVVFSTSELVSTSRDVLEAAGVQVVRRTNIGLCLGAYRDLALLLQSTPEATRCLRALVLCNDSNLLVQPPKVLLEQLERWTIEFEENAKPVLAGLTDSVERDCYHLQSFFLFANRALLQHPSWLNFWLQYAIHGGKDAVINHGEIGVSQAMLMAGVELRPAFPLVQGLLSNPAMASELRSYGISLPVHVNQTLFAWRSLLSRGFPFVKKRVLFQLAEHRGQRMAISELAFWIPKERQELLCRDIQELLISHYSGRSPRMD